jgi:copper chaperone CopZ
MAVKANTGDSERPPRQAEDLQLLNDEPVCEELPHHLLELPTGIVGTAIDADAHALTIDYDPRLISDDSVRQVAERLAPEAQRRFDKCVMRLGGRACEACALKLERKAENIKGVRRATATFIGGVMSVTFDNAILRSEQVIDLVRETGAPVTAFTVPRELPHSLKEWLEYYRARLELGCTVSTFVFMIAGWIAPRVGLGADVGKQLFPRCLPFRRDLWCPGKHTIATPLDDRCRSAHGAGSAGGGGGWGAV